MFALYIKLIIKPGKTYMYQNVHVLIVVYKLPGLLYTYIFIQYRQGNRKVHYITTFSYKVLVLPAAQCYNTVQ